MRTVIYTCLALTSLAQVGPSYAQEIEEDLWLKFSSKPNVELFSFSWDPSRPFDLPSLPGGIIPDNPIDPKSWEQKLRQIGDIAGAVATQTLNVIMVGAPETMKKAINDALNSADKAVSDAARNLVTVANDIVDAGQAMERYAERKLSGLGQVVSDAEARARQGKVFDAVWHSVVDPIVQEAANSLQVGEESKLIGEAQTAAAQIYGGPGGSAALASARAYKKTGNVDLAFRVGVMTYASSSMSTTADSMPQGTLGEVLKKAGAAGAIGGVVAAASGGDQDEIVKAFMKSGGAVIVQSGEAYAEKNIKNPLIAKADSYCFSATGSNCTDVKTWYDQKSGLIREYQKKIATGDTSDIGMLLAKNKQWMITWNKAALKAGDVGSASIAFTYIGEGSMHRTAILTLVDLGDKKNSPLAKQVLQRQSAAIPQRWVALQDYGAADYFFTKVVPQNDAAPFKEGDIIRALRSVYIRPRMIATSYNPKTTPKVEKNGVVVIRSLKKDMKLDGRSQLWAQIDLIQ